MGESFAAIDMEREILGDSLFLNGIEKVKRTEEGLHGGTEDGELTSGYHHIVETNEEEG